MQRNYATTSWRGSRKPTKLEKQSFFSGNEAGMSMKTKDRLSTARGKAGMSMKKRHLAVQSGNVVEKTGS
jgi:hypothetical protein